MAVRLSRQVTFLYCGNSCAETSSFTEVGDGGGHLTLFGNDVDWRSRGLCKIPLAVFFRR